jgi:DNA-binding MarR family transcriptional regulator
MKRPLRNDDYVALGEFRRAMRQFLAFSAEGAQREGLTPQQHQALLAIRAHQGAEAITVGELAESLLVKNHSALGLVGRLAERGHVARLSSTLDRRRVLVRLTAQGEKVLSEISVRNLSELGRASASLRRVLKAIRDLEAGE